MTTATAPAPSGVGDRINRSFGKLQFSGKKKLDFYKKFLALLKNNVPIPAALETIYRVSSVNGRKPYAPQALAAQEMLKRVQEGATIYDAMREWVPERDLMILQATEFGSPLVPIENVIQLNEAVKKIRSAFVGALSYPLIVIVIALVVTVGISTSIVPAFVDVVPDMQWTGLSAIFVDVSGNIAAWWPLYGVIIALFVAALLLSLPFWADAGRTYVDKVPPWSIYRLWMGSSWLFSLSAMLSAGITEIDALTRLQGMQGRWIRARNEAIRSRVANGQDLGDALLESGYDFPDLEINLTVAVYANLSSSDEAIKQVASDWIDESAERLGAQAVIMRTLALLFAAGIIAITVLAIFDMETQITSNLGF